MAELRSINPWGYDWDLPDMQDAIQDLGIDRIILEDSNTARTAEGIPACQSMMSTIMMEWVYRDTIDRTDREGDM